jgi:hypothetical protein
VQRDILARLAASWAARPVRLAKEEVREWAQYSLVCREWRAAFQSQPLYVVFDEVPSFAIQFALLLFMPEGKGNRILKREMNKELACTAWWK